jgi:hypothetical protein
MVCYKGLAQLSLKREVARVRIQPGQQDFFVLFLLPLYSTVLCENVQSKISHLWFGYNNCVPTWFHPQTEWWEKWVSCI